MDQAAWRILMVDDDEEDHLITESLLRQAKGRKIFLDWCPTIEAGRASLKTNHYDAVLVDYDLGAATGIEFIREASGNAYPAPLILYTGRGSYEIDLEAMHAGAALYLNKGEANPLLLERAIRYAIERKQAEKALRESKESYRQLFDAMHDGFALHEIICDREGKPVDYRFLEVNPAFEELTGLQAADILGKTVLEVLPETEPYWIEIYGEVALSGNSIRFENYSQALGKYFEVVAFSPRQNQFASLFTDITTRKQAEKDRLAVQEQLERRIEERTYELKKANEILETIFSSIDLLVAFLDRDFNFIRVNENYARTGGHDPAYFVGKNHFELYPDAENEAIFRRTVATGQPSFVYAKAFQYPDQPQRGITYWDWSLHPIKEADGQVSGVLLTLVEVTGRYRAELKSRQYAGLLERLFQSAPDATLLVDAAGNITRANRQAEAIFGYSEEELIGQPVEILLPERFRSRHAAHRSVYSHHPARQLMGEETGYSARRKDGQDFQVEVMLSPLEIDDQSNVICVIRHCLPPAEPGPHTGMHPD